MTPDLFSYEPAYPAQPGFKARDTSKAAAKSMKRRAPTIRERALNAIKDKPLASFEIAALLGESYRSVQPRTSELAAMNLIVDSNLRRTDPETGKLVIVWTVMDKRFAAGSAGLGEVG